MPGNNGVQGTLFDGGQHPLVGPPRLAAVRGEVVVLEVLGDLPAPDGAEFLAVQALALDACPLAGRVPGDPGVDAGSNRR